MGQSLPSMADGWDVNKKDKLMKKIYSLAFLAVLSLATLTFSGCKGSQNAVRNTNNVKEQVNAVKNLNFAIKQLRYAVKTYPDSTLFPRSEYKNGKIKEVRSGGWTSGFFPGELWYLYHYTGNVFWRNKAEEWTRQLVNQQYNTHTHDVGFMINCSYGNGFRFTGNKSYKQVIINAAKSLSTRFNPKVGAIKSWDHTRWQYPVIIDNMMNLQLLFHAWKLTGNKKFYHIAYQHALTTMRTHVRSNGSTFHVVDFDSTTGKVIWKGTAQGYSNSSTWARGEAWALYGFTMAYRYTKDARFLNTAKKVAHYILTNKNLPSDYVPYWDYNAPNIPKAPRDASAAAAMSCAFIKLSGYVSNPLKREYIDAARKMLHSLSSSSFRASRVGSNDGFILKRSVGNMPAGSEITVPEVYADYYYIEANLRYLALEKKEQGDN